MISEREKLGWAFLQTVCLPTLTCLVQSGKKAETQFTSKKIILHSLNVYINKNHLCFKTTHSCIHSATYKNMKITVRN